MKKRQSAASETLRSSSSSSSSKMISTAENGATSSSTAVAAIEHSEQTTTWKHRVVNIGCMSGVFHFFSSKYYIRRKFLTTTASGIHGKQLSTTLSSSRGVKEEQQTTLESVTQQVTVPPSQSPVVIRIQQQLHPSSPHRTGSQITAVNKDDVVKDSHQRRRNGKHNCRSSSILDTASEPSSRRRLSSDVPRSPTIPPEIRRSSCSINSSPSKTELPTPPSVPAGVPLLARLMGLEEDEHPSSSTRPITTPASPASSNTTTTSSSSNAGGASDKRRKLLGALEKCDEDLQSLKRMIEAIRILPSGEGDDQDCKSGSDQILTVVSNTEQPSPVSVLDDFNKCSPTDEGDNCCSNNFSTAKSISRHGGHTITTGRRQSIRIKTPAPDDIFCFTSPRRRMVPSSTPRSNMTQQLLHQISNYYRPISSIVRRQHPHHQYHHYFRTTATTASTAEMIMADTVEEVCKEVEWGIKWEFRRIGMFLEDSMCGDLVEEIVREMSRHWHFSSNYYSILPPSERCKRKLRL